MAKATTRIFARYGSGGFVGRDAEVDRILKHATGADHGGGLAILATPSAGASELLRHSYDRLFNEQQDVIPFYFEIRPDDRTAQSIALRFLCEFLLQAVAFRRHDARIIAASPTMGEMSELAAPADGHWIDRLVAAYQGGAIVNGERSFVRNCLSAPLRAAANGARICVMIDGLHSAGSIAGGDVLVSDLIEIFGRSSIPFVFAGHRRFLYSRVEFATMGLDPLSFAEAGQFIEKVSKEKGIKINDQTRDLIAVQLGGKAAYINWLFSSAAAASVNLENFDQVQQAYTDEIFGGRISKHLDKAFELITPAAETRLTILRLLSENAAATNARLPVQYWRRRLSIVPAEFERLLDKLHQSEIVNIDAGHIRFDNSNLVISDYLRARVRLEITGDSRALAVGEALSENIKRAPAQMARYYRKAAAIGLRELLRLFDGREMSPALIDYSKFRDTLKGLPDAKIADALRKEAKKVKLPTFVFSAHSADLYPRLNDICDPERSAVAFGFSNNAKRDEVIWMAVEIDSKLEAEAELAEFWCDRLEMIAVSCNFTRYKFWLVAPEGFSPEALKVLKDRKAHGSSRKQIELMKAVLELKMPLPAESAADEFEIVVPMGEDTEMIAAQAVEEIAKRAQFPPNAITQIKTALVEACINATEHSLSPDRKIYHKFSVDHEKLVITIANRGVRLTDKNAVETLTEDGRRGWGLKLMKRLMDDVKIEQTDDGTRITMVKYIGRGSYQFPEPI